MPEVSELIKDVDMFELACKTTAQVALTDDEKDICSELDARFKEIGAAGHDSDHEIAQFIRKTINEEIYDAPDELLDELFDRGTINDNDDFESVILPPKNTLVAHEAARGGNVERSYLDVSVLTPTWKNRQIEFDISFGDVKRNGWKSVALYTQYAEAALRNAMFKDIFTALDSAITSGAGNYITEATSSPTQATMDALALYIMERNEVGAGNIIALTKYIQAASKLTGFVSDEMKNEVHRTGRLGTYDGVPMTAISSANKIGGSELMIPDKRIFGIANKIGSLNMKGELTVYQDEENQKESFHIMVKNFTYGYAFNSDTLQNVCKVVLA